MKILDKVEKQFWNCFYVDDGSMDTIVEISRKNKIHQMRYQTDFMNDFDNDKQFLKYAMDDILEINAQIEER